MAASLRRGGSAAMASFFNVSLADSPACLSLNSFIRTLLYSLARRFPSSSVSSKVGTSFSSIKPNVTAFSSSLFTAIGFSSLAIFFLAFSRSISLCLSLLIRPSFSLSISLSLSFSLRYLMGVGASKQAFVRASKRLDSSLPPDGAFAVLVVFLPLELLAFLVGAAVLLLLLLLVAAALIDAV
eukprot:Gb_02781 [translate_table: standard]